ncbi:helix-turn-helix transcriptional regulator [Bosea spartocytisi]|jgi:hypothetical protein
MAEAEPNIYLTAAEVSRRWRVTPAALAQWRSRKTGPAWTKFGGRVVYALRDIEAYEAAQRREGAA